MAGSFQVGQRFILADQHHRLVRDLGDGQWQAEDEAGKLSEHSQKDLLSAWNRGELRFGAGNEKRPATAAATAALRSTFEDAYRQSYPEEQWRLAQARLAYLRRLQGVPFSRPLIVPLIKEIWEDQTLWKPKNPFAAPPAFSTVASWRLKYESAGNDIRSLIERRHDRGNSDRRLEPKVLEFIDDAIDVIYLTPERRSIAEVRDEVRTRVARENQERLESEKFSTPSFSAVKRLINRIPIYDRWVARYGKRLADIKFRASMGAPVSLTPLQRACMDHCRMDVMVVDDQLGLPLGRPWLTLVMDENARYLLGYYLGFEEPSNVSVMRALKHAMSPKEDELAKFPKIQNAWDAWGPMGTLVVDNGLEFHGFTIRNGTERFGITMQFCPRRKPWFKGKIERFFGSLNTGLLQGLPGKTFSSILEKHDYDPAKHAVIRLSTLREIMLTWVVDIYHQKTHRTLGCSPAEAWFAGIRSVDRWLPDHSLSLESAFSQSSKRNLTHKGIEFDSLLYNSPDLRQVRKDFGDNIEVEVRTMDDNLGSVVVVAPDEVLIRVGAIDHAYAEGLTRWQHGVCRRFQRRMHDDEGRVLSLGQAKERIRELIQIDQKLIKRGSRKAQARFTEGQSPTTPAEVSSSPPIVAVANALLPPPASPTSFDYSPPAPAESDDEDVPDFSSRRLPAITKEAA